MKYVFLHSHSNTIIINTLVNIILTKVLSMSQDYYLHYMYEKTIVELNYNIFYIKLYMHIIPILKLYIMMRMCLLVHNNTKKNYLF